MSLDVSTRQIDDFLCDDNFLALTELAREQRLLFITEMTETRVSAFLAWLFRPHEGHGLGDQPIRELLHNAWLQVLSSDWEGGDAEHLFAGWTPSAIVGRSFRDLCVETEYRFGRKEGVDGKNRPVDVMLVSRANRLVVLIENKFGSAVHGNQLAAYRKQAEDSFPGFKKFYIYLDPNTENLPDDNRHWIPLRHDWLIDLITTRQKSGLLSERALNALSQVKDYLIEESAIQGDEAVQVYFSALLNDHCAVLASMRELKELGRHARLTADAQTVPENVEPLLIEYHQRYRLWDALFRQMDHLPLINALRLEAEDSLEIKRYTKRLHLRSREWKGIRDHGVAEEAAWGLRLSAWKPDRDVDVYSVRSIIDFNLIEGLDESMVPAYSEAQESQLRAIADELRTLSRRSSKSDRWIRLMEQTSLSPKDAASVLAREAARINEALKKYGLLIFCRDA